MKVYLKCIYENNLGDDLFIKTICERYPNTTFTVLTQNKAKIKGDYRNLKVVRVNNLVYRILRKISFLFNSICIIDRFLISRNDIVVAIGGSLFMESKKYMDTIKPDKYYNTHWYMKIKKPLYIIGANIGPVYNDHYIQKVRQLFKKANDVCLRDKKSISYVKDLNVRLAPDIVFGALKEPHTGEEERRVIISLINCQKKSSQMKHFNASKYENAVLDIIKEFIHSSYKIVLFSFCKEEGDETEINKFYNKLPHSANISKYYYDGNIEEALELFSKSSVVVGSRYHATVIGMAMNKAIIPIVYNDKTRNLLKDIGFNGEYIDIEKNIYPRIKELAKNTRINRTTVSRYKKESEKHFLELDRILK